MKVISSNKLNHLIGGAVNRQRLDIVNIFNNQITRYKMKQEKHITFSDPWLELREIVRVLEETRDAITDSFEGE